MKRKGIRILLGGLAVAIVIMALLFPLHVERAGPSPVNRVVSLADTYIIVIGHPVLAQGADYTCDGVDDNVQFQQALNDLPAGGGQLFVLTGDYQWADLATVTRAIDNVSIIGVGHSVTFTGDGVTDIFSAGGNNWFFSNLEAGAPGIDMGATTDWMWLHLTNAGTYYSLLTEDDELGDVVGPASATDEAIVRFDGATGKLIQDYTSDAPTVSDTGDITMATGKTVDGRDVSVDGTKLDGIDTGATLYPDTGEQAFLDADHNKLDAIEAGADVTDTTNVAAAGALMDPDIDNVDDTHVNWGAAAGQVDADDVPASATRFWAGETGADVTDAANVEAAGALMNTGTDNVDDTHIDWGAAAGQVDADDVSESATRFWAGETGADVTDATNVDAAGAVMEADFNTQTILVAITDNTPTALVVGEQAVVGRLTGGNITALNIGVSDNFIVQIDSTAITATEYARFTANGLESRSESEFQLDYNLQIGVDIQAWDTELDDIAALSDADSNFIVGSGTNWVVESGATARASLGLTIGTDVAAHTHASQHGVGGSDPVFPADPNADRYLKWDDTGAQLVWATAAGGDAIWDADTDTGIQTEESADEDILRFDTGGAERAHLDATSLDMAVDVDFNEYKAIALVCDNGATVPASPTKGQWFLHTPTGRDVLMNYNGSDWNSIISFGPMTMYVDTGTGADEWDKGGTTTTGAFATIQYAINQIPGVFSGAVTITATAETYTENIVITGKSSTGDYGIIIRGTWAEDLAETTATGGTAGTPNTATQATVVDTGAGWTVNTYTGKWVKFEDDTTTAALQGDIRIIESNTSDTLSLVGGLDAAPVSGDTFTIVHPGTTVGAGSSRAIGILDGQQVTHCTILTLASQASISIAQFSSGTLSFIDSNQGSRYMGVSEKSRAVLDRCYIHGTSHGAISNRQSLILPQGCLIKGDGGASDWGLAVYDNSVGRPSVIANIIDNFGYGGYCNTGAGTNWQIGSVPNNVLRNCTTGIQTQLNAVSESITDGSSVSYDTCTTDYATATGGQVT